MERPLPIAHCTWSQDGDESDIWATGCGQYFCITDDTPTANKFKFCCYCGGLLEESLHTMEVDDE